MKAILSLMLYCLGLNPVWATNDLAPTSAKHGMVVTEQHLASQVGVSILRAGGNAIDAAVAVGYALAVVDPCCGNIGGGGFMTIRLANGKSLFLNFRERAPLAANENLFLDKNGNLIPNKSTIGYSAVAVPGTVMGLDFALKKYGTMSRQQVIAPAIELAEKGFILVQGDIEKLLKNTDNFKKTPNVAAIFLKKNEPYQIGDRLIQTDLAHTLKEIAKQGPDFFYKGKIASTIVSESQKKGGILSKKDFSDYYIEELNPLYCSYQGYNIMTAPLPSSGGITLCEILNIVESYSFKKLGFHSSLEVHYLVEAMKIAYMDRNSFLGDPKFVKKAFQQLISKDYAKRIRKKIKANLTIPSAELLHTHSYNEGNDTTHYSIVDKFGNAVAVTYTLNSFFGAQVIAGNTGFFLNNEMDDFTVKLGSANQFGLIQGKYNVIEPGKRPLSSMVPTIILKDKNLIMVLGSPGGPKIITSTLLTIINVLNHNMTIQQAVNAPRFHHQWFPDIIDSESSAFSNITNLKLIKMGHHIRLQEPWGAVEAIYIDPNNKIIYGANDKRRPAGKAIGY